MAHPYAEHRQHKVERSRAQKMAGTSSEAHSDVAADRKLIKAMVKPSAMKMEGKASGGRLDKYARGGKVKKASTNVNVIIAPQGGGGAGPAMPPPLMAGAPAALPPAPPSALPPPMPQKRGGRAYASGGSVKEQSVKAGTPVMNSPGKNDTGDIYRGRQITYAKGGPVEANRMGPKMRGGAESGEGRLEKTALQKRKG